MVSWVVCLLRLVQLQPSCSGEDAEANPLALFGLVIKLLLARVMIICLDEVEE